MPVADIELVRDARQPPLRPGLAQALADELGRVLQTPAGRTWVRLRTLDSDAYAENGSHLSVEELPVFVTLLLAQPPQGDALREQAGAVTRAVAGVLGHAAERVHVQYAPAAAGRQAFGGHLVGPP